MREIVHVQGDQCGNQIGAKRKEWIFSLAGNPAKRQCLERYGVLTGLETRPDDNSPKGYVDGATILEARSKMYFLPGVTDDDVKPILDCALFLELWVAIQLAQNTGYGLAKHVRIEPAPEVDRKGKSAHKHSVGGKLDHRTCSTRKFLFQVHLDKYLDEEWILAGDGEHLRRLIRFYIIEKALAKLDQLDEKAKRQKQAVSSNERKEVMDEARTALFFEIARFVMVYWMQPGMGHGHLKGLKSSIGNTFADFPVTEEEPMPLRKRASSHGDAQGLMNVINDTNELLSKLQLDFKQHITSQLRWIAGFLGAEDKPRSNAAQIWEKFLSHDGAGDELIAQMEQMEMDLKADSANEPRQKFVMPSAQTLICRRTSLQPHWGHYLGEHTDVRKCEPEVNPDHCKDFACKLKVKVLCANGKYNPGPAEKILQDGPHLVVCQRCQGQTLAQMESKGYVGCHCTRECGNDLAEAKCPLYEATVPAHLHNLVVGPPSCTEKNNHVGALDLSRFLLYAQLHQHFSPIEAAEMIDGPDPVKAAFLKGKTLKTVQMVAYRPALSTSK